MLKIRQDKETKADNELWREENEVTNEINLLGKLSNSSTPTYLATINKDGIFLYNMSSEKEKSI